MQRAIERQPGKIEPYQLLVVLQGHVPELSKHPGRYPLLKAGVGRAAGANARRTQRFPLTTRAQDEEDPVQYVPVRHPPPVAAQGVHLWHVNRQLRRELRPKRIRNAELLNRSHPAKLQPPFAYSDSL